MPTMSRRALLGALLYASTACVIPLTEAAAAAPTNEQVIVLVKDASTGVYKLPSSIRSSWSSANVALVESRALTVAKSASGLGMSAAEGGGILTRFARPLLAGLSRGGIWGALLNVGLLAGLTWALSSSTLSTDSTGLKNNYSPSSCAALSDPPGSILDVGTNVYKSGSQQAAYLTEYVSNPGGGTVPSPGNGFSWAYQTSPDSSGIVKVVFSKVTACGELINYPNTKNESTGDNLVPQQKAALATSQMIADTATNQAKKTDPVAVAGTDIVDPGTKYSVPATPTTHVPADIAPTVGGFTDPIPASSSVPTIQFPASDPAFTSATSTDPGTGTGTDPGTGNSSSACAPGSASCPASINWGTAPAAPGITDVAANPFSASTATINAMPQGQCPTINFDWQGKHFVVDGHCTALESKRGMIATISNIAGSITAFSILMRR